MDYCNRCGLPLASNTTYCTRCGARRLRPSAFSTPEPLPYEPPALPVQTVTAPPAEKAPRPGQGHGIAGLVLLFVVSWLGILAGIAAIILGAIAQKQAKALGEPKGMATAGLVLGIVTLALVVLLIACAACAVGALVSAAPDALNSLGDLSSLLGQ